MMAKRILVIDSDLKELDTIHQFFDKMRVNYTLHRVGNGRDALLTLMGSSNAYVEYHTGIRKERPDIILLSTSLPDMTGSEFLEIISKYYSLADIKIFLMATQGIETEMSAYESFSIAGHIIKPITEQTVNSEDLKRLRMEMGGNPLYVFLPSFIASDKVFKGFSGFIKSSLLKIKTIFLPGTYTVGAKILTGTVLTAGLGLGLANIPRQQQNSEKPQITQQKPRIVFEKKHLSSAEEIETIKKMYADLIPAENEKNQALVTSRPQKTKLAGLISTHQETEKEESENPVLKQKPDFKIKVSEEKDSIPD